MFLLRGLHTGCYVVKTPQRRRVQSQSRHSSVGLAAPAWFTFQPWRSAGARSSAARPAAFFSRPQENWLKVGRLWRRLYTVIHCEVARRGVGSARSSAGRGRSAGPAGKPREAVSGPRGESCIEQECEAGHSSNHGVLYPRWCAQLPTAVSSGHWTEETSASACRVARISGDAD